MTGPALAQHRKQPEDQHHSTTRDQPNVTVQRQIALELLDAPSRWEEMVPQALEPFHQRREQTGEQAQGEQYGSDKNSGDSRFRHRGGIIAPI
jgi:hypothetical protein